MTDKELVDRLAQLEAEKGRSETEKRTFVDGAVFVERQLDLLERQAERSDGILDEAKRQNAILERIAAAAERGAEAISIMAGLVVAIAQAFEKKPPEKPNHAAKHPAEVPHG